MPSFIGLLGGNGEQNAGAPRAYLNLMVFDLNFQQVGNTLYKQISTAAQEDGSDISHEYISINPVIITEPGYVYIYLSNENVTPVEVFFDDFEVTHTPTDIVQKDDYYPFGLTFNSLLRENSLGNKYLFNGKERQELTGWDDYGARMYMADIGRWGVVDPMAQLREWVSPYNFVQNNPIYRVDP
ncbi:RHS repeat-associated core domain-containing protein [Algoriphagus sp. C2-6-M1]|uniref:RHS repeat-associated core domain-containing protein n=1 Tax=Algoriphagus persicinus TaxID=3108754 RepID=UPI002B391421|nr:RHS repeat-associated core domain-containing protein [Algoriphagus sp. C2-6-M1]MEB2780869.1 RHS repeat-associated core domain-containing protein [Algoriphagus sp. C2-6-M1]